MNTIKNLLSKTRRSDEHVAWRKAYADEINEIQSRAGAATSHGDVAS